jgi:hypothetical protein
MNKCGDIIKMLAGASIKRVGAAICTAVVILIPACSGGGGSDGGDLIRKFAVDSSSDVISKKGVSTDKKISRDGGGSLRIDVTGTQSIELYQVGGLDLEETMLVYQAALRTENLQGETFLEMLCYFQDKGEFFSRNYNDALSGTNDWTLKSTPFRLRTGENPDIIKLNLYVNGKGTVWIDEIKLMKRPLN